MNKDPAFLFYSSDFLVGTMLMSNDQVGKYIRLMCLAHQKGGYLTKEDMFKICNEDDKDVLSKFEKDGNDIYYNERLLSEIVKRKKYSDSRRNNRKGKTEEKEEDMSIICESYEPHMENENINISIKSKSLNKNKDKTISNKFGEFNNVILTDEEKAKIDEQGLTEYIDRLSSYLAQTGKKYKSHYATILNWSRRDAKPKRSGKVETPTNYPSIEVEDVDEKALAEQFAKLGGLYD